MHLQIKYKHVTEDRKERISEDHQMERVDKAGACSFLPPHCTYWCNIWKWNVQIKHVMVLLTLSKHSCPCAYWWDNLFMELNDQSFWKYTPWSCNEKKNYFYAVIFFFWIPCTYIFNIDKTKLMIVLKMATLTQCIYIYIYIYTCVWWENKCVGQHHQVY